MRHAVMILFLLKDRSSLQYFITQGMCQSSMFHTFHTICNFRGRTLPLGRVGGGKGGIPGRFHTWFYEACLKTQPAHKPLITRRGSFPLRGCFFSNLTVGSFSINSRLQKYSITTIHHDEKHDFFLSFSRVPVSVNAPFLFFT